MEDKYIYVVCAECKRRYRHYYKPNHCPHCGSHKAFYKGRYVTTYWTTSPAYPKGYCIQVYSALDKKDPEYTIAGFWDSIDDVTERAIREMKKNDYPLYCFDIIELNESQALDLVSLTERMGIGLPAIIEKGE